MLRVSLERLIKRVDAKRQAEAKADGSEKFKRLTIGEISDGSGVHRNIVSRILNNPEEPVSTLHIDRIIQFFFYELRKFDKMPWEDPRVIERERIQQLVALCIDIFPEHEEHGEFIKSLVSEETKESNAESDVEEEVDLNVPILWQLYLKNVRPELKADALGWKEASQSALQEAYEKPSTKSKKDGK